MQRLLQRSLALAPRQNWAVQRRCYALSRFPDRKRVGTSRHRPTVKPQARMDTPTEGQPAMQESELWQTSMQNVAESPSESLKQLLLGHDIIIIERQLEMLNIFIGYEQCNKYSISSVDGVPLGYITEEPGNLFTNLGRQVFATHRPFKAIIMDVNGAPLLWLRRPFAWINSRMYVQRVLESAGTTEDGLPILDTFAEVQQVWHPFRRQYDLFLKDSERRILSRADEPQPTPEPSTFTQFAAVDSRFLAWDFKLDDGSGGELGLVSRSFKGLGLEIFTDTGKYAVRFGSPPAGENTADGETPQQSIVYNLNVEQRALALALAVNIDCDYFSRHSGGIGPGFMHFGAWD